MLAAIVTGASSGIGLEIAKTLTHLGYRVYGLARDFSKTAYADEKFSPVPCDLSDTAGLCRTIREIQASGDQIHILVNNAGIGYFGPHEQLKPAQIEEMVTVNLQAPLILTGLVLREIKKSQGYIINISSFSARKSSTHGCAYAATKAGLSHFGISLFDEIRKTGAKVVTIHPDITQTPFYDHLDFREGDVPESYITPRCVAEAVRTVLSQRSGTVITEISVRPQRQMIVRKNKKQV